MMPAPSPIPAQTPAPDVPLDSTALTFAHDGAGALLRFPALSVAAGRTLAIAGPSGLGKTTLLHLLAGWHTPRTGHIRVLGHDLGTLDDAARRALRLRRVGLIPQDLCLLDYLTARQNILLPLRSVGRSAAAGDPAPWMAACADQLGITPLLDRRVTHLSAGERQRVAITRALLLRPPVVLADEATGCLDPTNAQTVCAFLQDYARTHGAALVMVTHDMGLLADFDQLCHLTPDASEQPPQQPTPPESAS